MKCETQKEKSMVKSRQNCLDGFSARTSKVHP